MVQCIACGDTGKNSRGFPCEPCLRTGRIKSPGNAYIFRRPPPDPAMLLAEEYIRLQRLLEYESLTEEQRAERELRAIVQEMNSLGITPQELRGTHGGSEEQHEQRTQE